MTIRYSWVYKRLYDGVNNRLHTVACGRWAAHCRPTWISFLLTERCNSRCLHCDIWQNRGKEDSPTVQQWESALADLRRWLGPTHVCLTGGEALLVPYAVDLVRYGTSLGLFVELLTHGYWKDQGRIEQLAHANPWRITLSLDGIGDTHDRIRGREGFFERTNETIETLLRLRREHRLDYSIRLKTVVMSHNLDCLSELAEYATRDGVDILFQPIEQNYNTEDDAEWYLHSDNWPSDPEQAAVALDGLMRQKKSGLSIVNSVKDLENMRAYFLDPAASQISVKAHTSHENKTPCAALSLFQVQANGDVRVCSSMPPVGNIKSTRPREIWQSRPRWWESGCCLERRMSVVEKEQRLG